MDTYPEVTTRYPISPPLDLRAGDVTVHDALTVHSAPENETDSNPLGVLHHMVPRRDALHGRVLVPH